MNYNQIKILFNDLYMLNRTHNSDDFEKSIEDLDNKIKLLENKQDDSSQDLINKYNQQKRNN